MVSVPRDPVLLLLHPLMLPRPPSTIGRHNEKTSAAAEARGGGGRRKGGGGRRRRRRGREGWDKCNGMEGVLRSSRSPVNLVDVLCRCTCSSTTAAAAAAAAATVKQVDAEVIFVVTADMY